MSYRFQSETKADGLFHQRLKPLPRIALDWPTGVVPNGRHSTLLELSNSINSLKSLFSRIGIHPGLEFENSIDALFGSRAQIFFNVGGVGFLVTAEDSNDLLHLSYSTMLSTLSNATFPKLKLSLRPTVTRSTNRMEAGALPENRSRNRGWLA